MKELEARIENTSSRLMNEAQISAAENKKSQKPVLLILIATLLLFNLYSALWFRVADTIRQGYLREVEKIATIDNAGMPVISGYPGKIKMDVLQQTLYAGNTTIKLQLLHVESWPLFFVPIRLSDIFLPFYLRKNAAHTEEAILNVEKIHDEPWPGILTPIEISTGPLIISYFKWKEPLILDRVRMRFTYRDNVIKILESRLQQGGFSGEITGTIDLRQTITSELNLQIALKNHEQLLGTLTQGGILEPRAALFIGAGLDALRDEDGVVRVPLTQHDRVLYAGPLPVASLPGPRRPALYNQPVPAR